MTMTMTSHSLSDLSWYRLSFTLLNIRRIDQDKGKRLEKPIEKPVFIFDAIIRGVTNLTGIPDDSIIFHLRNNKFYKGYRKDDYIDLDVFFCRHDLSYVEKWRSALTAYLDDPIQGKNFKLVQCAPPEKRSYQALAEEIGPVPEQGEICLAFFTPMPFKPPKGKPRIYLDKAQFIRLLEKRIERLFRNKSIKFHGPDEFRLLPYYWHYDDSYKHASKSCPGNTQILNGCVGRLYIKGNLKGVLPFIILCSELHAAGADLPCAQGHYRLHPASLPYFEHIHHFPDVKTIAKETRDVLERYDHAVESLSIQVKYPFDEKAFAAEVAQQLISKAYRPSPHTAFLVEKKSGASRLVERLDFRDIIVQQYLLKTIGEYLDYMFEEESIGFRKRLSRKKALEVFKNAVAEGYRYVVESDVDDFFPSVDLDILTGLLNCFIPDSDAILKDALQKSIRAGYVLGGEYYERKSGLAQGAPLSPILANLYLDAFDESIQKLGVKMVRYADDFIILTKSKEEAEQILSKTEAFLSDVGLRIKKEKTSIHAVKEGFEFLGMRFDQEERDETPEETYRRMKKPLYVTEPFCFLSVNGDAIDILKQKSVIATIPLRRISEIMVMDRSSFSTALARKCVEMNIPLTITLGTGYYVTTVKPDSKKYYDVCVQHAMKYNALTETEFLCIAKEFAVYKLMNYMALFKQRRDTPGISLFIGELERTLRRIHEAGHITEVRGHEGSAAKKIFQHLNAFIDEEPFKFTKRIRKGDKDKVDPINSLLNFGYYLLFSRINATVRAVGLNPYLGFLHSSEDNYESFVADIEELFRARIDRFIIRLLNLKMIKKIDFKDTEQGFFLTENAKRIFIDELEGEMEKKNAKNVLSLKEDIYVQINILKNYLLKGNTLSFYEWKV